FPVPQDHRRPRISAEAPVRDFAGGRFLRLRPQTRLYEPERSPLPAFFRPAAAAGRDLFAEAIRLNTRSKASGLSSVPSERAASMKRSDCSGSSGGGLGLRGIAAMVARPIQGRTGTLVIS